MGYNSFETVNIEAQEELALTFNAQQVQWVLLFEQPKDFADVYIIHSDVELNKIKMNINEVVDVKWAIFNEIEKMILNHIFFIKHT